MILEYVVIKHGLGKYEPCHRPRTNTPCERSCLDLNVGRPTSRRLNGISGL